MCGIAGIVSVVPGDTAVPHRVELMQQALAHRGPDGAARWTSPGRHATFANTRLAIIDRSAAAAQPMSIDDGRLTLTFNGEIYNFMELRRELESRGAAFRTRSDAEVILHAYDAYGDSCVTRLRGMFAFALWDERKQRCVLARDRFGIKPLYYHVHNGGLVFASEVKALLDSGAVPRDLDGQAMYEYFRAGSVQDPRTLLRGVRNLEAGHVMTWDAGQARMNRYWDFSFAPVDAVAGPVEATQSALRDSIRHHFVSDVPVGVFLSGGVDSTCLVALAAEAGVRDLHTFTLSLAGSRDDEGDRARRTAEVFATHHDDYRVDAGTARRLYNGYLAAMDQPSIDGLNTFAISRFAAERGMKVMLSGIGADELFGGYPSFSQVPRLTKWRRRMEGARSLRAAGASLLNAGADPRYRRLADLLAQPPSLTASYSTYRAIFTRAEANALCKRYAGSVDTGPDDTPAGPDDPTPEDGVSRLELSRYARNQLLRDGDVMSMACGVELRTPFLDASVVDTVCGIPSAQRLRPGKQLLVESVTGFPDGIVHRPKRCFQFPFEQWSAEREWQHTFKAVDQAGPVSTATWYRKWCVLALEHWLTTVSKGRPAWT